MGFFFPLLLKNMKMIFLRPVTKSILNLRGGIFQIKIEIIYSNIKY